MFPQPHRFVDPMGRSRGVASDSHLSVGEDCQCSFLLPRWREREIKDFALLELSDFPFRMNRIRARSKPVITPRSTVFSRVSGLIPAPERVLPWLVSRKSLDLDSKDGVKPQLHYDRGMLS